MVNLDIPGIDSILQFNNFYLIADFLLRLKHNFIHLTIIFIISFLLISYRSIHFYLSIHIILSLLINKYHI